MCRVLATLAQCECFSLKCNIVTNSGDVKWASEEKTIYLYTFENLHNCLCCHAIKPDQKETWHLEQV